eukprot:scaffold120157_cov63-Phaeocystis_antarctica.AAC.1
MRMFGAAAILAPPRAHPCAASSAPPLCSSRLCSSSSLPPTWPARPRPRPRPRRCAPRPRRRVNEGVVANDDNANDDNVNDAPLLVAAALTAALAAALAPGGRASRSQ